jgi:hypothetical protein
MHRRCTQVHENALRLWGLCIGVGIGIGIGILATELSMPIPIPIATPKSSGL